MGTDDSTRPTRRSVLKATGTALATGLAVTGTAAADCELSDTATMKYDYYVLEEGDDPFYEPCVGDTAGPLVEEGDEFQIEEICSPSDSSGAPTYIKVDLDFFEYYWIDTTAVECS